MRYTTQIYKQAIVRELTARNVTLDTPIEHETLLKDCIVKWQDQKVGQGEVGLRRVSPDQHSELSFVAALQELKDEGLIEIRKRLKNGKLIAMHTTYIALRVTPAYSYPNTRYMISLKGK